MRPYEIIKIDIQDRIDVEIEFLDTRERQFFAYPINRGWDSEIEGEPKFIRNIRRRVEDGEFDKKTVDSKYISSIRKKFENKKYI